MSDKNNEVIVVGHRNPDTDAITAAIIYSEFLRRMNVNAKAYRLGDLNNETKFVLKSAGVKEPDMIPDNIPEGTEVALVDHNESNQKLIKEFILLFDTRPTIIERFEKNACDTRGRSS
jgi:inorganic pyrophosphatase/exopolyphosphatase